METVREHAASGTQSGSDSNNEQSESLTAQARNLLNYRFRIAGMEPHEADDLTQECLVELVQRADKFDESRGSFEAWIGGFARNALRSWYRKEALRKATERPIEHAVEIPDPAVRAYEAEAIEHCLSELCLVDRELVYMRFALEMSFDDIARAANITGMNARKRVSRSVERLRRNPAVREALGI